MYQYLSLLCCIRSHQCSFRRIWPADQSSWLHLSLVPAQAKLSTFAIFILAAIPRRSDQFSNFCACCTACVLVPYISGPTPPHGHLALPFSHSTRRP
ncbi:hypothetical protein C8Q77DRAFT_480267 [Trametes polyzona]|nr:hypothetical protein C8Q77DRAFT_480267 [Trametes polyzona]